MSRNGCCNHRQPGIGEQVEEYMKIVKFEGPWSERDERIVRQVVRRTEAVLGLDIPETLMGRRWICRCEIDEGQTTYIASRASLDEVLVAPTITQLIKQLLVLNAEVRLHARGEKERIPLNSDRIRDGLRWSQRGERG